MLAPGTRVRLVRQNCFGKVVRSWLRHDSVRRYSVAGDDGLSVICEGDNLKPVGIQGVVEGGRQESGADARPCDTEYDTVDYEGLPG